MKAAAARCGEKIKAAIVGPLARRVEEIVAVAGAEGPAAARAVPKGIEREQLAKISATMAEMAALALRGEPDAVE